MALSGVCSEGLRRPSAGLRRKFVIALVRPANLDRCKTFFDLGNYSAGRCPEYCCARDGLQVSRPRMEHLGFTTAVRFRDNVCGLEQPSTSSNLRKDLQQK